MVRRQLRARAQAREAVAFLLVLGDGARLDQESESLKSVVLPTLERIGGRGTLGNGSSNASQRHKQSFLQFIVRAWDLKRLLLSRNHIRVGERR